METHCPKQWIQQSGKLQLCISLTSLAQKCHLEQYFHPNDRAVSLIRVEMVHGENSVVDLGDYVYFHQAIQMKEDCKR